MHRTGDMYQHAASHVIETGFLSGSELEHLLHQLPLLVRRGVRIRSVLELGHILLPLFLTGKGRKPRVILLPVKVVHRIHYHEQPVTLQIDLHVQNPDLADTGLDFRPHPGMYLPVLPDQLRIVLQCQCLAISLHKLSS